MLRIYRCRADELNDTELYFVENFNSFISYVKSNFFSEYVMLFASPEKNGDIINCKTGYSGKISKIDITTPYASNLHIFKDAQKKLREIVDKLEAEDKKLPFDRSKITNLLRSDLLTYAIDDKIPVVIPLILNKSTKAAPSQVASASASASSGHMLRNLLVSVIAIGLTAFLIIFLLQRCQATPLLQTEGEDMTPIEDTVAEEQKIEESNIADIKDAEEKAEPEQEMKEPEKVCTTVINEEPTEIAIVFDASGSMNYEYGGGTRIEMAKQAAVDLVRRSSEQTDFSLVLVNKCDLAINKGNFAGNKKGLIEFIDSINTLEGTPLVDGILKMTSLIDGVDKDSVAVVISDGEDSCLKTIDVDLCQLADEIHRARPKLKINTVFIGDNLENTDIECLSKLTKGKSYNPKDGQALSEDLKKAATIETEVCK